MNTPSLLKFVYAKSQQLTRVAAGLQPIFLLVIRLYWGWQFFQTGWGKLMDIPKVTAFFRKPRHCRTSLQRRFGGLQRVFRWFAAATWIGIAFHHDSAPYHDDRRLPDGGLG